MYGLYKPAGSWWSLAKTFPSRKAAEDYQRARPNRKGWAIRPLVKGERPMPEGDTVGRVKRPHRVTLRTVWGR